MAAPPKEGGAVAHLSCCRGGEYFIFYHCNYFTNFYSTNLLSLAFHDGVTRMAIPAARHVWRTVGSSSSLVVPFLGHDGLSPLPQVPTPLGTSLLVLVPWKGKMRRTD